jgi:heptose I phosphotransferase
MSQNHYSDPIKIKLLADSTCQHFVINRAFKDFLTKSKLTTFDAVWSFPEGKLVKKKGLRSVLCVHFGENVFYFKKHTELLNPLTKLILFFRAVISRSEGLKEFYNYCAFRSKGLGTAIPVAAGMRYTSWLTIESFLITQDFSPLIDLEEIVLNQPELLQGDNNLARKHNILRAIGQYARKMHQSGFNHKDFNATHLLLNDIDAKNPQIALFDLQRVDKVIFNRFRWTIKSLSELFYTLPANIFSENDRCFLFKEYKETKILSWLDKMQYQCILKKIARIARHCRKRNLSPKMKED